MLELGLEDQNFRRRNNVERIPELVVLELGLEDYPMGIRRERWLH